MTEIYKTPKNCVCFYWILKFGARWKNRIRISSTKVKFTPLPNTVFARAQARWLCFNQNNRIRLNLKRPIKKAKCLVLIVKWWNYSTEKVHKEFVGLLEVEDALEQRVKSDDRKLPVKRKDIKKKEYRRCCFWQRVSENCRC